MELGIKEMEILIECKRLVERLLWEKKYILERMDKCGKDCSAVQKRIDMMERALEGKPPLTFEERFREGFGDNDV